MASKKQIEAGGAFVRIFADDSPLRRALKDASKRIKDFAKPFIGAGKLIGGALATAAAGLVATTKMFANYADTVGDAAARTGLSAETLSELGYAAKLSGSSMEDLEKGFRVFQKQLVSGANADVLKNLGIDAASLKKASPDVQLNTIIAALAKIQDPTQKAALAMQVFGKAGANLVPLLNEGEAGIAKLRAEAQKLGVSLSDEQVAAGQAFNDALDRISLALQGLANRIGAALAPMLTFLADQVLIAAETFGTWLSDVLKFVGSFETAMATANLAWVTTWTNIVSFYESSIAKVKSGAKSAQMFLANSFDQAGVAIQIAWSSAMNQVAKTFGSMYKKVSKPLEELFRSTGLNKAADMLKFASMGIEMSAAQPATAQLKEQEKLQQEADNKKRARAIELANFMAKQDAELGARENSRQAEVEKANKALIAAMEKDKVKAEENARRRAEKAQMGMAQAVGDIGAGAETAGTFTAAAISGLGAGSLQADMLSALKEVAGNTAALVDEVAAGGLQP